MDCAYFPPRAKTITKTIEIKRTYVTNSASDATCKICDKYFTGYSCNAMYEVKEHIKNEHKEFCGECLGCCELFCSYKDFKSHKCSEEKNEGTKNNII